MSIVYDTDSTGKTLFPLRPVTGVARFAALLRTGASTVIGEWPTDTERGNFLHADFESAPPADAVIRARFRRLVRSTPGFVSLESLTVSRDGGTISIASRLVVEGDDGPATVQLAADLYDPAAYGVLNFVLGVL